MMHIGWCGPVSLEPLREFLGDSSEVPEGYAYPLGAQLVREYLRSGCRVSVVTSDKSIRRPVRRSGELLNLSVVPRRSPRACARDLFRKEVRLLAAELLWWRPDVVHGQWTYEFAEAGLRSRIPSLVTARDVAPVIFGHVRDGYRFVRMLYSYTVVPRIRHLSVPSPYLAAQFKKWYLRRVSHVVPNGIEDSRFREPKPLTRRREPRIVAVTGWDARKNPKVLLRAFGLVRRHWPDTQLAMIGSGLECNGAGAQWARRNGLAEAVEFRGRLGHDETIRVLEREADLFVHTTLEESFGMTIIEAVAAGVPVIAGRESGAVPWVLGDGRYGKLVDVGSPEAVANAIVAFLEDPLSLASMARTAGREMKSRFGLSSVARDYRRLMQEVLAS